MASLLGREETAHPGPITDPVRTNLVGTGIPPVGWKHPKQPFV